MGYQGKKIQLVNLKIREFNNQKSKPQNKQSLFCLQKHKVNNQEFQPAQPHNKIPQFRLMRRQISRQREIPISQKVKKMFRYSPSYEAQKCYSKLPLRYSYASNITKVNSVRQDQINCEYSSVKEKHLETNQCNDTSSWIAKLVSGIQDQDDENKNLHKLSSIQNHSLNDLPEDSQDHLDNQFIVPKTYHLFNLKNNQATPQRSKFQQQVPITNPIKKSIKQALIEIELMQNKQGLTVPPVTRVNSSKKDKQNPKNSKIHSKINSNDKKPQERSKIDQITRKSPEQKILHKRSTQKSVKSSLINQKAKTQAKRKLKTLQKCVEKSIQVQNLNVTQNLDCQKVKEKTFESQNQSNESLFAQTCKNSYINFGTKKQSIHRVNNVTEEAETRKNSLINKEDLSQCKEQLKMVEEYGRNLNMKNLFSQGNQVQEKSSINSQLAQMPIESNKRIGGIKKNVVKKVDTAQSNGIRQKNLKEKNEQKINLDKKEKENQYKYSSLSTKREFKEISLNYRNSDPRILIVLDENHMPSSRRYLSNLISNRNQPPKQIENNIKIHNQPSETQIPIKAKSLTMHQQAQQKSRLVHTCLNQQIEAQNSQRIIFLFKKLKLDPKKDLLDKNNMKIRGLTEQQRTQLGSIIAKIHYQNFSFDLQSFSKQFKRMNIECTQNGCLSQQRLQKNKSKSPLKQFLPLNSVPKAQEQNKKPLAIGNPNASFDNQEEQSEIVRVSGIGHRRKNSNIIKKKLFEEIKRISYLEEVAINQLEKNSRITEKNDSKENASLNNLINKAVYQDKDSTWLEQCISKDPYIEAPSLYGIESSQRDIFSERNGFSDRIPDENLVKIMEKGFKGYSELPGGNETCMIERLNKKLSCYIDKNQIENTFREFNLNFSELKKHIR